MFFFENYMFELLFLYQHLPPLVFHIRVQLSETKEAVFPTG